MNNEPRSSVGRLTVDLIRRSWVWFLPRSKDFFSTSCGSLIPFTTQLTVWSSTAVCCFYDNNSIACRFYYHTEHVYDGRREVHGVVKKTTLSFSENYVGEIENGKYWFRSTSDLLRSRNQSRDKGASSWLTAVPLVDQGLVLNKREFRDSSAF